MRVIIFIAIVFISECFAPPSIEELYTNCIADSKSSSCTSLSIPNMIKDKDIQLIKLKKSIFEKTNTFNQRKKDLEAKLEKNILKAIKNTFSKLSVGKATMIDYNADSEVMTLSIKWSDKSKDIFSKKERISKFTITITPSQAQRIFEHQRTQAFHITVKYISHNLKITRIFLEYKEYKYSFSSSIHPYITIINHLMWKDEVYTDGEKQAYLDNKNIGKAGTWYYANKYCKNLKLGGYRDWRLPNKSELLTLYKNKSKLKNVKEFAYWSSTSSASYTSNAWLVNFYNGYTFNNSKYDSRYVRCVRAGQ